MNGQITLRGVLHGQLRVRGVQSVAELLKEQVTVEVAVNRYQKLVSAMMTSALLLKGAVTRNYDVSNISRQLSGISNDDISSDVITISSWIRRSAKKKLLTDEKIKGEVEVAFSTMMTSALLLKGAVTRNYDVSNISRQLSGISNDDVSSDVITISSWIRRSAKKKLLTDENIKGKVEVAFSNASYSDPAARTSRPTTCVPATSTDFKMVSLPPAGQPDASTSFHPVLRPASGQPVESTSSQLLQ
ncbi:hypothetical protein F511_39161 [Dorcoceras hygrometricum]|uniref:Uncharacterized protein n=1 Tax=Dorcoceras hygrometricum TaxID=472368 RepID=A0A2Z7A592_9LAMI|nr:hypothetical protein F511_39161 [Dorcoceras hygrometricum]